MFVACNKVLTTQYYLWFVSLIPMVFARNKLGNEKWKVAGLLTLSVFIVNLAIGGYFAF